MTPAAPVRRVPDVALVLEGGGMRAAYSSGFVQVLLEEGIEVGWVGGISAGTTMLCNYLSRDVRRTRRSFTDFAADPRFGGWGSFVRGRGYFDAAYIYGESGRPDGALPLDWETFRAHPAQRWIGAFDARTGETVAWTDDDLREPEDLYIRCRASSTMPVIMPPTRIGDDVYVDGALGPNGGIPLDAAQAAGFTRFVVVLTQERGYVKPPQKRVRLLRSYFRRYPAVPEAIVARPARYTTMREQVFDAEARGDAFVLAPERMTIGNSERSVPRLVATYEDGLAHARRELPALKDFLGL